MGWRGVLVSALRSMGGLAHVMLTPPRPRFLLPSSQLYQLYKNWILRSAGQPSAGLFGEMLLRRFLAGQGEKLRGTIMQRMDEWRKVNNIYSASSRVYGVFPEVGGLERALQQSAPKQRARRTIWRLLSASGPLEALLQQL